MTELILELLEIMDNECSSCKEWKKNKPKALKKGNKYEESSYANDVKSIKDEKPSSISNDK